MYTKHTNLSMAKLLTKGGLANWHILSLADLWAPKTLKELQCRFVRT